MKVVLGKANDISGPAETASQADLPDPFAGIPSRVSDAASSVGGAPAIADLDPVAVAEARGALSGVVPSGVMAGLALLVELDASGVVVDVRDFAGVLSGPTLARVRAIMVGRRLFGPSVLVTTGWRLIRF